MEEADFELRRVLGLLQRQLRLILIVLVVGVGATALVVFSLTPVYQASTLVEVQPRDRNLLDPSGDFNTGASDMTRVASELEIMRSDATILGVVKKEALTSDTEFGPKIGFLDRMLAFLQIRQPVLPDGDAALRRVLQNFDRASSVSQVGLSSIVSMSVRSTDRNRAAELANAWAQTYIDAQVSAKIDSTLNARNVLQARLGQARAAMVAAEQSLDTYIDGNLARIVGETGRADVADLGGNLRDLLAEKNVLSGRFNQAEAGLRQKNWELLTNTLQSDALRELERQREQVAATLEKAAEGPAVNLRAELAGIEQRLGQVADQAVADLRRAVSDNQSRETDLRQRLRTAVLSSALPADMLGEIFDMQQSAELGRQQYQTLMSRTQDLDAQATLQIADSRIISPALAPEQPAFPNTLLSLVGAGVISLAAGVGLAFLRENLVGGLLTEDQTEAVLKLPVAAATPRLRKPPQGSLADLMLTSPLSQLPEAIRRIRVTIDQRLRRFGLEAEGQKGAIVVMVTSSTANEGKSTISLSLARAYGASHKNVCLIDCDLRRPSIEAMAGLPSSDRLLAYLSEDQPAIGTAELVVRDTQPGVYIIGAGERADVPTDHLIGGPNFARLLNQARARFDVVILDTPPVGPVADGLYLAGYADLVLFVVMSGRTSQTEARLALGHLRTALRGHEPIVAVLNGQERASARYKSSYGYSYYSDPS
ncbi:GumC family protein [Devosia sp. A16]|uniref:GumC family protein n=1 Tax=Devosia sp. A16 TaxID=1736675 RepID=UPI0006D8255E|nr:Wzz/FepE/Etk N-terminal domain-containing protein [Devosia sp. A16]